MTNARQKRTDKFMVQARMHSKCLTVQCYAPYLWYPSRPTDRCTRIGWRRLPVCESCWEKEVKLRPSSSSEKWCRAGERRALNSFLLIFNSTFMTTCSVSQRWAQNLAGQRNGSNLTTVERLNTNMPTYERRTHAGMELVMYTKVKFTAICRFRFI
jgi:hypothetical protein